MITYPELDEALARWKARQAADSVSSPPSLQRGEVAGAIASGTIGGAEPDRKRISSLDWSMDQAVGNASGSVIVEAEETVEVAAEDSGDAPPAEAAAPVEESTGSTDEIDLNQIEETREI